MVLRKTQSMLERTLTKALDGVVGHDSAVKERLLLPPGFIQSSCVSLRPRNGGVGSGGDLGGRGTPPCRLGGHRGGY